MNSLLIKHILRKISFIIIFLVLYSCSSDFSLNEKIDSWLEQIENPSLNKKIKELRFHLYPGQGELNLDLLGYRTFQNGKQDDEAFTNPAYIELDYSSIEKLNDEEIIFQVETTIEKYMSYSKNRESMLNKVEKVVIEFELEKDTIIIVK